MTATEWRRARARARALGPEMPAHFASPCACPKEWGPIKSAAPCILFLCLPPPPMPPDAADAAAIYIHTHKSNSSAPRTELASQRSGGARRAAAGGRAARAPQAAGGPAAHKSCARWQQFVRVHFCARKRCSRVGRASKRVRVSILTFPSRYVDIAARTISDDGRIMQSTSMMI